jgi:hypothetical protein
LIALIKATARVQGRDKGRGGRKKGLTLTVWIFTVTVSLPTIEVPMLRKILNQFRLAIKHRASSRQSLMKGKVESIKLLLQSNNAGKLCEKFK